MPTEQSGKDDETFWLQELDSLGITAKRMNELNDKEELANLADNIKQTLYQDYKTAYDSNDDKC